MQTDNRPIPSDRRCYDSIFRENTKLICPKRTSLASRLVCHISLLEQLHRPSDISSSQKIPWNTPPPPTHHRRLQRFDVFCCLGPNHTHDTSVVHTTQRSNLCSHSFSYPSSVGSAGIPRSSASRYTTRHGMLVQLGRCCSRLRLSVC